MMTFPRAPEELDTGWIQAALRAAGAWPAVSVYAVHAERIGIGYGLDGAVARLRLQGDGPASVVAKWSGAESASRESRFYRHVAPLVEVAVPAFHGVFIDEAADQALLLLEDVAPARQGDAVAGADRADALALVEAEAALHARFWDATEAAELATIPRYAEFPPEEVERTRSRLPVFLERFAQALPEPARAAFAAVPERLPGTRASLALAPSTIVHWDLHLDNVLFRADGTPVILDWAGVARGPAALDVVRPLIEGMTASTRRAHQAELKARYVEALRRRGVGDYDVARLDADLRLAAEVTAAWVIRWAGRPEDARLGPGPGRVRLIVESLVGNTAALLADLAEAG